MQRCRAASPLWPTVASPSPSIIGTRTPASPRCAKVKKKKDELPSTCASNQRRPAKQLRGSKY
ncbi:hypothetical protein B0H67DRAFT_579587 [Lasiosphaeris hirsuta]|uniref:Uncharacterized protein n=1 Tax=Lasiosphaeris hirsuta TaxID=260670 RepID=A0AA40AFL7_9PEZI|nr:hypothetical protein B0H67DRAFT_579587 [Lasiosphaeris hirsuta]